MRFIEFTEPWFSSKLADICEINPKSEALPNSFIYIDLESVANGQLLKQDVLLRDEAPSRAQRVLSKNDVLFQMVRPYQKNNLFFDMDGKYVASTGYAQIRTEQNSKFVFQLLHNQKFVDNVIERCTGTSYPAINSTDLGNINISYPSLLEQTKIASFLSLIDERIITQIKIIEQLETQMLGLQEKIFKQKIRFKSSSGKGFQMWKLKKGGELFESISNKNHNSDLPILAITQDKGAVPRDLIDYQITVTERSIETYKVVEIGDFIISLRSFQGGIEHSNYKGICSPAYIILKNKVQIATDFYKYYFKTLNYIKLLNKKLEGIRDGKMISYSYFADIFLPFPELEEQTKIASFLSKIDEKIQTEKAILEQFKQQKKYLLQQMFV